MLIQCLPDDPERKQKRVRIHSATPPSPGNLRRITGSLTENSSTGGTRSRSATSLSGDSQISSGDSTPESIYRPIFFDLSPSPEPRATIPGEEPAQETAIPPTVGSAASDSPLRPTFFDLAESTKTSLEENF